MPLWSIKGDKENITDDQLLQRYVASGDLDDLGRLYSRYIHLVYGVCLKYFRNRDDSQDAVMDIFEKIISELQKHTVTNFKSWLYVLTKNFCLMSIRSEKKWIGMSLSLDESTALFMENSGEMHPVDREDLLADMSLEDCIQKLKEEQRRCIEQFYYNNRCYREIADNLEIDEKKVKSHLQNAKRNLKICLEGKDGKEEEK